MEIELANDVKYPREQGIYAGFVMCMEFDNMVMAQNTQAVDVGNTWKLFKKLILY